MTLCPRTLFFSSKSMVAARATVNPFFSAFVVLPLIVFLPILALVPQSGTPEWYMTSVEIILHSLLTLFARCLMQNLSPTKPDVTRTKALFPQQSAKLFLSCLLWVSLLTSHPSRTRRSFDRGRWKVKLFCCQNVFVSSLCQRSAETSYHTGSPSLTFDRCEIP